MKKQGKPRRGYVPGDAQGNWMRAYWGVRTYDPYNPPRGRPDFLRLFLVHKCYGVPRDKNCPQVNFYTARELVELAGQALDWRSSNRDVDEESKQRQIRNLCRELGIQIKKAPLGRPRRESKSRKN